MSNNLTAVTVTTTKCPDGTFYGATVAACGTVVAMSSPLASRSSARRWAVRQLDVSATDMVQQPAQQQQAAPSRVATYRAARHALLARIAEHASAARQFAAISTDNGDYFERWHTTRANLTRHDLGTLRMQFADVLAPRPAMVPQQVQQQQARHNAACPSVPRPAGRPLNRNRASVLRLFRTFRDHWPADGLADREAMAATIASAAHDGMIAVASGGTDCDGYRFGPYYSAIPATVTHFQAWYTGLDDFADGPVWGYVVTGMGDVDGDDAPSPAEIIAQHRADCLADALADVCPGHSITVDMVRQPAQQQQARHFAPATIATAREWLATIAAQCDGTEGREEYDAALDEALNKAVRRGVISTTVGMCLAEMLDSPACVSALALHPGVAMVPQQAQQQQARHTPQVFTEEAYRAQARALHGAHVDIHADATISPGTEGGVFVQAWVWVPDAGMPADAPRWPDPAQGITFEAWQAARYAVRRLGTAPALIGYHAGDFTASTQPVDLGGWVYPLGSPDISAMYVEAVPGGYVFEGGAGIFKAQTLEAIERLLWVYWAEDCIGDALHPIALDRISNADYATVNASPVPVL